MNKAYSCKDVFVLFLALYKGTKVAEERVFKCIKDYPSGRGWGWGRTSQPRCMAVQCSLTLLCLGTSLQQQKNGKDKHRLSF